MSKVRVQVVISGRVQGVGFRYFTQQTARRLGLTGWVKNRPDGAVEALFEGERGDIEQALDACRQGPPGGAVDKLQVDWQQTAPEFIGFSVCY